MDIENIKNLSNTELKLLETKLTNEFEEAKNKIIEYCRKMEKLENDFNNVQNEIKTRKTVF